MEMLQIHEEASESSITVYHEFLQTYKKRETIVYGFVEGKTDPSFYKGSIDGVIPDGWSARLIPAGNKKKVLKSYKEFDWSRFPSKRICFFIDKDLSSYLNDVDVNADNLYITPKYSIENELEKESAIERSLTEVYAINKVSEQDLSNLKTKFSRELDKFKNYMVPVMAQILIWRKNKSKAILDDFKIGNCFKIESGELKLCVNQSEILQRLSNDLKLVLSSDVELQASIDEFNLKNGQQLFIRGKYILWFVLQYLESIRLSISAHSTAYNSSPKMSVTIGPKNAMCILGPRIRCPECLNRFLSYNFVSFIQEVA